MKTLAPVVDPLIERLCEAVRLRDVEAITDRIKGDLESFIPAEGLLLPDHFRQPKPGSYARRLLYHELVAHGRNTGDDLATMFSNDEGSLQTSLGSFVTGTSYTNA